MKKSVYVELCSGLGGIRSGLREAGWACALAIDSDPDAAEAHRLAFGTCEEGDVTEMDINSIPPHDLLAAGFPCQPFSSSGTRTGFLHAKGHVFNSVARVCASHRPAAVLLENVRGLLSNAYGHTFASVIRALTSLNYEVSWTVLDALWFGIPQARPRVFIVANRLGSDTEQLPSAFDPSKSIFGRYVVPLGSPRSIDLDAVIDHRAPRVGLKRPTPQTPFGVFGAAVGSSCLTWDRVTPRAKKDISSLGDIVCPSFKWKEKVRSVRYWGHSGVTRPYFKAEPVAHCLGTNIGAGPTFGISNSMLTSDRARKDLLQFANWVREERDHLIFRLVPTRAALLFGNLVEPLQSALAQQSCGATKQYVMLGNLVVPEIAFQLGEDIRARLTEKLL